MPSRSSIWSICGPPPCTTIGLMPTCFSSTTSRAKVSPPRAHRMPAIFDDEGLAGIAAQIGQRLARTAALTAGSASSDLDGVSERRHRRSWRPRLYRRRAGASAIVAQSRRASRATPRCRAAFGAGQMDLGMGRGVPRSSAATLLGDAARALAGRACRSWSARSETTARPRRTAPSRAVRLLDAVPRIDQQADPAQAAAAAQIMLHQPGPRLIALFDASA